MLALIPPQRQVFAHLVSRKALAPVVEKLADETVGKYKVVTVDIDDAPAVAQKYGIRGVPTLAVFRNGEKRASHVGVTSKEAILKLLDG